MNANDSRSKSTIVKHYSAQAPTVPMLITSTEMAIFQLTANYI